MPTAPLTTLPGLIPVLLPPYLVWLLLPCLAGWHRRLGWTARNYRGERLPVGVGLALGLAVVAGVVLVPLVGGASPAPADRAALAFIAAAGLAGWVDDRWGGQGARGLAGHLGALAAGRLTTGQLKLVVGGCGGLAAAWWLAPGAPPPLLAVAALVAAAATNAVNLLDLRPGRALKGFWLVSLPLVLLAAVPAWYWGLILASLVYAPWDLGRRVMLGDAGAAVLGAAWGMAAVLALAPPALAVLGLGLVGLHLVAERRSLGEVVTGRAWLRRLDRLGRERDPDDGGATAGKTARSL